MDPATNASLLREYGGWGLSALLIPALVYAIKGWLGCFEARIVDAVKLSAMLERASAAIATVAAALESRSGRFERVEDRIDESGQKIEAGVQKLLSELQSLKGAVDELRRSGPR